MGGTEVPPIWCTYLGKCVPLPYVRWGCSGKCPRGGMAAAVVGEVLYYFRCSEGVSFKIWSHTCGNWNFPKFLFKESSLTLMYMASLMFLAKPCDSLSTMEKHSWLTGYPVTDVCRYMGEGAFRCPCICHQVSFLIPLCIVLCSLYLGICTCK